VPTKRRTQIAIRYRPTTREDMSFTFKAGRIIADARVEGVSGKRILGGYQLHFGVELTIHPHTPELAPTIISQWTAHVSCATGGGDLTSFAPARPELPMALQTFGWVDRKHAGFLVDLSPQQLADLEQQRGGGGLRFALTVSALAGRVITGASAQEAPLSMLADIELTSDVLTYSMGMSDWVRLLNNMDFRQTMVFSVQFPAGTASKPFGAAQVLLEQARERLLQGQYDAVVSLARKIMESIAAAAGEADQVRAATNKFRDSREARESMTKRERGLVVQEAVRHYTHLAHHVDEVDGASEWYSRADAVFVLALATAVFSDALARHSIDQE
jgi:hypothetical protein